MISISSSKGILFLHSLPPQLIFVVSLLFTAPQIILKIDEIGDFHMSQYIYIYIVLNEQ